MLGKTFKGMTDEVLAWQTERLQELETHRDGHTVYVRPELVVEIAFDGVQTSTRYPGGVALRFARVKGYRPDKRADEADTIETVRAIHAAWRRSAAGRSGCRSAGFRAGCPLAATRRASSPAARASPRTSLSFTADPGYDEARTV